MTPVWSMPRHSASTRSAVALVPFALLAAAPLAAQRPVVRSLPRSERVSAKAIFERGLVVSEPPHAASGGCIQATLGWRADAVQGTLASGQTYQVVYYALRAQYAPRQATPTQTVLQQAVNCGSQVGDGGVHTVFAGAGYPINGTMQNGPCGPGHLAAATGKSCDHPLAPPNAAGSDLLRPIGATQLRVASARGLGTVVFRIIAYARANGANSFFPADSTNTVAVTF